MNRDKLRSLSKLKKLANKRLIESGSENFPNCKPSQMAKIWNKEYTDIKDAIFQTIK